MKTFAAIQSGLAAFLQYGPAALSAVQGVETVIGAGNGQTKLQLAVAGVLAVAHAGETVPVPQVQLISGVVDLIVSTLNATGALGKPPAPAAIPPALPAAA